MNTVTLLFQFRAHLDSTLFSHFLEVCKKRTSDASEAGETSEDDTENIN